MENEIYKKCEQKINIIVKNIEEIKNKRIELERQLTEWCYVRDEDDRELQRKHYKHFKTLERIESIKRQTAHNTRREMQAMRRNNHMNEEE